jgi:hypothetical protein
MPMRLITVKSTVHLVLEELSYGPIDSELFEDQKRTKVIPWEVDQHSVGLTP